MKHYTVLLLYPDFLAENYGEDTYLAHVIAHNVDEAKATAQRVAWGQFGEDSDDPVDYSEDFLVLLVCEGHLQDIKEGMKE